MLAMFKTTAAHLPEVCNQLLCSSMKRGNIDQILDLYESGAIWHSLVTGKALSKEDGQFLSDYLWLTARNATMTIEKMDIEYNSDSTQAKVHLQALFEGRDPDGKEVRIPFESDQEIRLQKDGSWRIAKDSMRRIANS